MQEKQFGLIQVFYGNGKGKTTAAFGQAFRAAGRGFKIHIIQFMKSGLKENQDYEEYGELKAFAQFPTVSIERFGFPEWVVGTPTQEHIDAAQRALTAVEIAIHSGKYDIVIADEVLYAIQLQLLTEDTVLAVLDKKAPATEVILTGSHKKLERINERADLVTEVKKEKHPYDKGVQARIGTEF
jgi:cob(I)alamin adenosyltransferase